MKILLVEDDANLREVTQRSLEKERYVVEIAASELMIICLNLFIWWN